MSIIRNDEFEVRKSQLLTPYGIGSLIDINNQSIMIRGSEDWKHNENDISDFRLEKALNSRGFISPPIPRSNKTVKEEESILGIRFPTWFFSPLSRELKTFDKWKSRIKEKDYRDFEKQPFEYISGYKRSNIVPVRLVCACKNGHVQDFPWFEWAHSENPCKNEKNHTLQLKSYGNSTSLNQMVVQCNCGSKRSLSGVFNQNILKPTLGKINISCKGNYVWKDSKDKCKSELHVLLRSQSNLYFPNLRSSVNIPFSKDNFLEKLKRNTYFSVIEKELDNCSNLDEAINNDIIKIMLPKVSLEMGETVERILEEIDNHHFSLKHKKITVMDYKYDEYKVLTGKVPYDKTKNISFDLKVINNKEFNKQKYTPLLSTITLVKSLEIITALTGYSRIHTPESDSMINDNESLEEGNVVSLKREDGKYVALKSKGEGIFIEFSSEKIEEWSNIIETSPISSIIYAKENKLKHESQQDYVNPKFYMIHTFSHILMKELTHTSGYSSSSLKERLYFSEENNMYGVLIYTSSSDENGTLGGLVKQGIPRNLFRIINQAVERASWCSYDPVCIDSKGQGRDSLNLASCYACSLVSETSCEFMNAFLDRKTLIGELAQPISGFFTGVNNRWTH
ncbi:DrmB family protein [Salinicoccus hispanicus]|uniref:DUF1998 domain-containing protein n=1 Tax=Salinicoccus hispanicus TaxID=157225 RepID=A0A6N8U2V3_9STAP|nr:DUF1998 domain-containing protein [Salinicoccus hispanicus]MXQ51336.1 DUF1998 domain-containing protein [Salinicoccus hispanicus]